MYFRNKCKNFFWKIPSFLNLFSRHTRWRPCRCCSLEIFDDQLGVPRLVVILTCNWNQAIFTLFTRNLCRSAWRSQACRHPHLQLEPGHLHVVRSRSLLISLAFPGLSSSSLATGTGPSSRCLLEIFVDQLGVPRLVVILTCNWSWAIFTFFARDLCWSALSH